MQPGSLGVQAMCQLLQRYMIERGMGDGLSRPRFSTVTGRPLSWRYRGQITPADQTMTVEVDVLETGEDDAGRFAVADAWLWVDGKRIYHAPGLAMRVIEHADPEVAVHASHRSLEPAVETRRPLPHRRRCRSRRS